MGRLGKSLGACREAIGPLKLLLLLLLLLLPLPPNS